MSPLVVRRSQRLPADEGLLQRPAQPADPTLRSPAMVVDADSGEPALVTVPFPGHLAEYRNALRAWPMETTVRSGGIRNISRVFGYASRNPLMQRNCCRACAGAALAPFEHGVICRAAGVLAARLRAVAPDRAERDAALVQSAVLSDWLVHPDAWWTSGVVNRSSPLPYHRDRNNFDAWSAMVVVRRKLRGGHLHVPEYDLVVDCRDGDVVYFNGSDLIHGVTPMSRMASDGYRFSAVYYPVAKMAKCLPPAEEMARGRAARSAKEDDMVARHLATGALSSPL